MPSGDPSELDEAIRAYLKAIGPYVVRGRPNDDLRSSMLRLGLTHDRLSDGLRTAAVRFLTNRRSDRAAATDRDLLEELRLLVGRSDSEIAASVRKLPAIAVAAICNEFPGHRFIVGAYGDEGGSSTFLQPDHERLQAETLKNLWRRPADGSGRGLATIRSTKRISACIPEDVAAGELVLTIERLVENICSAQIDAGHRAGLLRSIAARLCIEGASGVPEISVAAFELVDEADGITGLADLLREITPAVLSDLEDARSGSARALVGAITDFLLEEIGKGHRRFILASLASVFPAAFRAYVERLNEALGSQYGGRADQRGRERSTRRWIEAHAGWRLNIDVLDVVWPIEAGALDKYTKQPVLDIIQETLLFADSSIPSESAIEGRSAESEAVGSIRNGVFNEANHAVNAEHVSTIVTMRLSIADLNALMEQLDFRLIREIEPMPAPPAAILREAADLRFIIERLQTWRRELERRLRQGDYLKGKAGRDKVHMSGARVEIPGIPASVRHLPLEQKHKEICAIALEWAQTKDATG